MRRFITVFTTALLMILLLTASASAVAMAQDIRVLIGSGSVLQTVTVKEGSYTVIDGLTGLNAALAGPGDEITAKRIGNQLQLIVNGEDITTSSGNFRVVAADDDCRLKYSYLIYRGGFILEKDAANGVLPINCLDIEDYLYGVVGSEIGFDVYPEAVKAQAVASRSYALASLDPTAKYDVKNTIASQVYRGLEGESTAVIKAVRSTEGEVVLYAADGSKPVVVMAYFHSNAGGHTEDLVNVWGSSVGPQYRIKGVASPYDAYAVTYSQSSGQSWPAKQYQWQVAFTPQELQDLAAKAGKDIGVFKELRLSTEGTEGNNTVSGRVTKAEIVGTKATASASKDAIRGFLGGLKSTLFKIVSSAGVWLKDNYGTLTMTEDVGELCAVTADNTLQSINKGSDTYFVAGSGGAVTERSKTGSSNIVLEGYGYGHGVGMSQWGAIGMAADGFDYQEIIEFYYCSADSNFYLGRLIDFGR